jgi:hypothetical protein
MAAIDLARLEHGLDVRRGPGQAMEVDERHGALPAGPAHLDDASSATSATARSEAWAAMQCSLVPSTACQRFSPPMAAQPEPGARLLHAA